MMVTAARMTATTRFQRAPTHSMDQENKAASFHCPFFIPPFIRSKPDLPGWYEAHWQPAGLVQRTSMDKANRERTLPHPSHELLTWRSFIFLILAFGLAVLGWFLLNPARAQAISLGRMPISLHSRFEADYSADLRGYAVPAVSIDLVDQVVREEAGAGSAEEQLRKVEESLKTPVPTLQPPSDEPTPQQPISKPTNKPTTRPTRAATTTPAATKTASPTGPVAFPTATATEQEQPKPQNPTNTPTMVPTYTPTAKLTATEKPLPTTRPTKTAVPPTATQVPTPQPTSLPKTPEPPATQVPIATLKPPDPTQEPPSSPTDPPQPPQPTTENPGWHHPKPRWPSPWRPGPRR